MMKLLLSSHPLSSKESNRERERAGGRETDERSHRQQGRRHSEAWAGGRHDEFGRRIKRVLIQLRKIYDLMRMWL